MEIKFPDNITYIINHNILTSTQIRKITHHNSNGLITMWKNGERQPLVKDVLAIATALNVTMDDLVIGNIKEALDGKSIGTKVNLLNDDNKDVINKMINVLYSQQQDK